MAKNNHIFNSLVAGEVSPKFFGRTNTQQYPDGCEELRNVIPFPQGGGTRRPGTLFKYRVFQSDETSNPTQVRLIPFQGTDGSRWHLIITDELVTNLEPPFVAGSPTPLPPEESAWRAINVDDGSIEAFTSAVDPNFDTYYNLGSSGKNINLNELQYSQSGDTMIITHGKIRTMKVTYDPDGDTTGFGAKFVFSSFPSYIHAAESTSTGTIVPGYNSSTELYRQIPFLTPGQVLSEGSFSMECAVGIGGDSPDGGDNNALLTFTFLIGSSAEVDSTWVGRYLRGNQDAKSITLQIYEVLSTTTANARVVNGIMDADPTTFTNDQIERCPWDDKHGWPRTSTFFDSRLVLGGTEYFPDQMWFSRIDNINWFLVRSLEHFSDFADPVSNDWAFSATLKQTIFSKIMWMIPGKTIAVGTNSGEFVVRGPDTTQAIGPLNYTSDVETPHGSAYIQAQKNENTTVFVQRNRKWLRELVFNLDENSFIAPNLNIVGEHMASKFALERADDEYHLAVTPGAFVAMVKQEVPWQVIWCLDNNGCLLGLTRDRNQNVAAWHSHELAGDITESTVLYKPQITSISSNMKSPLDAEGTGGEPDELYMAVKRRYDGAWAFYIEKLMPEWEYGKIEQNWDFDADVAPVYMDFAVFRHSDNGVGEFDEGIVTLDHLEEGTVVQVIKNGHWLDSFTVDASQQIDISAFCSQEELDGDEDVQLIIGFNYLGRINPLPPEVQHPLGSSMGNQRRIDRITINFYRTIGARFGRYDSEEEENTPADSLEEVNFPLAPDNEDPTPLYSGEKVLDFPSGYETRPRVLIESHLPFPFTVTHITARMNVGN